MIRVGPCGSTIRGHVLDCAQAPLEQKLRDYDPQLYVRWNPRKLKGWGLWEVRRRPNLKTIKEIITHKGVQYTVLDYVENGFENHIMDVPFLNYLILEKLKQMDTWTTSNYGKDFVATMEAKEEEFKEKTAEKAMNERRYDLKQHKTLIHDFMDYTLSGGDPSKIANVWPGK